MSDILPRFLQEIRYSLRVLRKTPAFTIGAVGTLALSIGATTAIFSVVYGVLLRQLPYRNVEQAFWIWSEQPGRDRTPFNVPDFVDYRDSTQSLAGLAGFFAYSANLSDEAAAERVQGIRATGNLFDVLGAQARIGRLLQSSDERQGAERVVVLTEPFWVRRFGADHGIIGRAIRLNGEDQTVVGVVAAGFALPVRDVEFVLPFAVDRDPRRGARNSVNFIIGVGRLADHVSLPQAAGELNGIARRLQERFPVENARKRGVQMVRLIDGIAGPFRTTLLTLFAAVGAVLLIAAANLANLMLTRAVARRKELVVRIALGCTRLKIGGQVLVEAMVVAVSGGALGVMVAAWGVNALSAIAPTALPRAAEVRVDVHALMFSLTVSSLTGILFAVIPALTSARVDVREALQGSSRGTTVHGNRVRGFLISSEVALSVALLVVLAMLAKSFANVLAVDPGFDSSRVLSARLTLPSRRFSDRDAIVTFERSLIRQLSSMPTVTTAGAITLLPLSGLLSRVPFTVEGRAIERERVPLAQFRVVSPGYFETMGIPLLRGRTFSERDTERTGAAAIVNEALARRWLDGLEPAGARLLIDDNDGAPRPVEIVGVVGNVRQVALDGEPTWDLYLTYSQIHPDTVGAAAANMFCLVRTTGDPMTLVATLTEAVRRADSEVAASQIRPMDRYLSDAVAPRRFSLSVIAVFALAALALATTGIYAVVLYSVSQRAHEIGIRIALGAGRASIVRLVMGQGIRFVVVGLVVGIVMAAGATRLLSTMFFGVAAIDGATFGEVAAVVAAVSIVACAVPTARAGRWVEGVMRRAA